MKKLLAALLMSTFLVSAVADDNDIAVMENGAGGNIVLTQQRCPIPDSSDFRLAYSWNAEMRIYGCWKMKQDDHTVHVLWVMPNGESYYRTYNTGDFESMKII